MTYESKFNDKIVYKVVQDTELVYATFDPEDAEKVALFYDGPECSFTIEKAIVDTEVVKANAINKLNLLEKLCLGIDQTKPNAAPLQSIDPIPAIDPRRTSLDFDYTRQQTLRAYSDCNDRVDEDEFPRNLAFRAESAGVKLSEWVEIMHAAVPGGYNMFCPFEVEDGIGNILSNAQIKKCRFIPAREGSVALYVESEHDILTALVKSDHGADEASIDVATGELRLWWD